jgi:hypothetical protein
MKLCQSCQANRATKRAGCADGTVLLLCEPCSRQKTVTTTLKKTRSSPAPMSKAPFQGPPKIVGVDPDASVFALAFRALMAKSFAIQRRQVGTNVVQVLIPVLIIILLYLLQLLVSSIIADQFGKFSDATPLPRVQSSTFLYPLADDAAGCNGTGLSIAPLRFLYSGLANDVVGSKPRLSTDALNFWSGIFNRSSSGSTVPCGGGGGGGGGTSMTTTAMTAMATASAAATTTASATPAPTTTAAASSVNLAAINPVGAGIIGNMSSLPTDYFGFRGARCRRRAIGSSSALG